MKLLLFGAGHYGRSALSFFGRERVFCFCDNSVQNNDEKNLDGKKIISFNALRHIWQDYIVVVCLKLEFCLEVCRQLENADITGYVVYEALQAEGMTSDECMEHLQILEERERLQRKSYLYLMEKAFSEVQYLKRHIDITTLLPATGSLRERQLKLLEQAEEFFEFIKELDIKPFLVFGNLIGAVRHRGFVPWDDDLDFGLIRNEYERLLEFAHEKCVVLTYEPGEDAWADCNGNMIQNAIIGRIYANKYIFNMRPDFVQISKCEARSRYYVMDIWAYDFYDNRYSIEDHKKWIEEVNKEAGTKKTNKEKMNFIRKARKRNPMVSSQETDYFFAGIDNYGGYPGEVPVDGWILSKDIFPLQKVKYENTYFWAPNNMEVLLKCQYKNFMEFPDDIGFMPHSGSSAE